MSILALSFAVGIGITFHPEFGLGFVLAILSIWLVSIMKHFWMYSFWILLFGLTIWSYGFNNIPLVRPIPLVDTLVMSAVLFSLPYWWSLKRYPIVRNLLILLSLLMAVVILRLIVDIPHFGLLAPRDALFALELWGVFPAIVLGMMLGERKTDRILFWLFTLAMAWFLLFPWREHLIALSPVVGIQRPVPLFAFTTAGFVSVPAFFWFLYRKKRALVNAFGASAALLILLFVQSRGAYLAFMMSALVLLILQPNVMKRWWKVIFASIVVVGVLWWTRDSLTGRLGVPVGLGTVVAQLQTLLGREGPGAGSFYHRLETWPTVFHQIMSEPLGPLWGIGLGRDLFQGFTLGPGILVRKPHNDFLEIWARLGIIGLLPWVGVLFVLLWEALKGAQQSLRHGWILALQIMLWITSLGQPAMGFAYTTVVWVGLTGLWIGTQLREQATVTRT